MCCSAEIDKKNFPQSSGPYVTCLVLRKVGGGGEILTSLIVPILVTSSLFSVSNLFSISLYAMSRKQRTRLGLHA